MTADAGALRTTPPPPRRRWPQAALSGRLAPVGLRLVVAVSVVLVAANVARVPVAINLAKENNFATFYHSAILAAVGVVLLLLREGARSRAPRGGGRFRTEHLFLATSIGFFYLGLDEALQIHERVARVTFQTVGLWERMLYYDITPALWEALFAPVFGVIGILVLVVLFKHCRAHRVSFSLGLLAMALWGLALVLEFVQLTFLIDESVRAWFRAAVYLEESFELLASTAFLVAMARVARHEAAQPP